jgi:photosystem II stability/assembly factor-like uncharacterized protein
MPFAAFFAAALALTWTPQISNTKAGLRGLHVVSSQVVWASGTKGTFLVTTDGGEHWRAGVVPGAESVDFRDVEAFDAHTAYLLSIGTGSASHLYLTRDGGESWKLLFTNPDAAGFFDALAFWDPRHGIILGDPVSGHFVIFTTGDGGQSWSRQQTPPALPDEGAFAASGTCLQVSGKEEAWFATGGPGAARVFHSRDAGKSWTVSTTPLSGTTKSSGIFSLVFGGGGRGFAAGGDYQKPQETARTMAVTSDGGKTWNLPATGHLGGYRSGATVLANGAAIAVGTSGIDFSETFGATWNTLAAPPLNAVAASPDGAIWAVGPGGIVLKLHVR